MKRLAVVTGAANGLGRAIALRLAADGARMALLDKDGRGLAALSSVLAKDGVEHFVQAGDLTDTNFIVSAFAEIERQAGAAEILVNNVGGSHRGDARAFADADPEMLDAMLALNLRPTVWATRQVIQGMQAKAWGRIINITSEAAFRGTTRFWDYGAAKAGVVGFTRAVAVEVARYGITVNAVGPGLIRTAAMDQLRPEASQQIAAGIPSGHPGEPEDIAHVVAFFASEGSRHVTGQTLLVNAGTWLL